jgi:hypothetical protein
VSFALHLKVDIRVGTTSSIDLSELRDLKIKIKKSLLFFSHRDTETSGYG